MLATYKRQWVYTGLITCTPISAVICTLLPYGTLPRTPCPVQPCCPHRFSKAVRLHVPQSKITEWPLLYTYLLSLRYTVPSEPVVVDHKSPICYCLFEHVGWQVFMVVNGPGHEGISREEIFVCMEQIKI